MGLRVALLVRPMGFHEFGVETVIASVILALILVGKILERVLLGNKVSIENYCLASTVLTYSYVRMHWVGCTIGPGVAEWCPTR